MENATERLVQFVEFVYLFSGRHVPQNSIREHELVGRIESGSIFIVLIALTRLQSHNFLTSVYIVDLENWIETCYFTDWMEV